MEFLRKRFKKGLSIKKGLLALLIILSCGFFLSGCQKEEDAQVEDDAVTEETDDSTDADLEPGTDEDTDIEDDDDAAMGVDLSDFSESAQEVGDSEVDEEYVLTQIKDTEMSGYHRFEFVLESDAEELNEVTASLNSAGGYIRVRLGQMAGDNSGIGYQQYRDINEQGILKLYHDVSADETEELYNIGVTEDTSFYLHEGQGDNLSVILDVEYPGEAASSDDDDEVTEDPQDFTDGDQVLSGNNSAGDVRLNSYSWAVSGGALIFKWDTSAASGNPIPEVEADYDSSENTITLTFSDVERDSVIGSDGELEVDLSGNVEKLEGSRSGGKSVYVFHLTDDTEYKLTKNESPNQVGVEIKL